MTATAHRSDGLVHGDASAVGVVHHVDEVVDERIDQRRHEARLVWARGPFQSTGWPTVAIAATVTGAP